MPAGIRTQDLLLRRQLLYPTELQAQLFCGKKVERVMGIEPTYPAWKAGVLPMNYTRSCDLVNYSKRIWVCQYLFDLIFKKILPLEYMGEFTHDFPCSCSSI